MNIMVKAVCEEILEEERMNEWKELKIDDLPSDILKDGVYEFMNQKGCIVFVPEEKIDRTDLWNIILFDLLGGIKIQYRKRQPEKKVNEWILYDRINLPSDLFNEKYDIDLSTPGTFGYRVSKESQPEKKEQSHEEIITNYVNSVIPESLCYSSKQILIREMLNNTIPPETSC